MKKKQDFFLWTNATRFLSSMLMIFYSYKSLKFLENAFTCRFEMNACNSSQTPIMEGTQLTTKIDTKTIDIMFYQQIVGSLSFVTHICYDIFVVVNIVNRFLKNSTTNTFQSHSIYFKVHKRDIGLQIFYPQNNYMVLTTHNDFN